MNGTVNKELGAKPSSNETKLKKKKRIFYFDQMRSFAIILVIVIHICNMIMVIHSTGTVGWSIPAITRSFSIIAVPLFLLISGALLLNRSYDLKDYLIHRFIRLILPVIFWGIIVMIVNLYAGPSYLAQKDNIFDIIVWFFNKGYWFSWMLISIYLFIPVINTFIKEYSFKGLEYFLSLWFIYVILDSFNLYPLGQIDLSYFAGYIGFILLGYYLNNKEFRFSDRAMYLIGLFIYLIFSIINCYLRVNCLYVGPIIERMGLITVLQVIGIFLFIKYFAIYSENNVKSISNRIYSFFKDTILGKLTISISLCSYGIYLTHYMFLHIGSVWVQKNIFPIFYANPIKIMPLLLIVTVILSWVLVFFVSKVPHLKKWTGMG